MLCHTLQAPLKPEKVVHPTNCITFLGIELDTVLKQARLPTGKLTLLLRELKAFSTMHHEQHTCTKRQLLSLIGMLAFACKVIPAGRIFLRRLLDLAHSVGELDHHLQIHSEASQDILWWLSFAESWNGTAFFLEPSWMIASDLHQYTDASSVVGYGTFWNGAWLNQRWPLNLAHYSIEWKELYAIVIACETWGSHWSQKRILFHCDNFAIVYIWETDLSRNAPLMYLVRALFFVAATHNINVLIRHIASVDNSIADALSRFQMNRFRALAPDHDPNPTPTPARLTFDSTSDWSTYRLLGLLHLLTAHTKQVSVHTPPSVPDTKYPSYQHQSGHLGTSVRISASPCHTAPSKCTCPLSACFT